jgi:hypothetical protein
MEFKTGCEDKTTYKISNMLHGEMDQYVLTEWKCVRKKKQEKAFRDDVTYDENLIRLSSAVLCET